MNEARVDRLALALRERRDLAVGPRSAVLLAEWVAGGGRAGSGELAQRLGLAEDHPEWLAHAYQLLDRALFIDGRFLPQAAGISGEGYDDKRLFRVLLSAFHPDRHADHADWLTPRSQSVQAAYRRFKSGEPLFPADAAVQSQSPDAGASRGGQRVRRRKPDIPRGVAPDWQHVRPTPSWRERLGRDRFLAHKLILLIALVAAIPVLTMLHDAREPLPEVQRFQAMEMERKQQVEDLYRRTAGLDLWAWSFPSRASERLWKTREPAALLATDAGGSGVLLGWTGPEPASPTWMLVKSLPPPDSPDWLAEAIVTDPIETEPTITAPEVLIRDSVSEQSGELGARLLAAPVRLASRAVDGVIEQLTLSAPEQPVVDTGPKVTDASLQSDIEPEPLAVIQQDPPSSPETDLTSSLTEEIVDAEPSEHILVDAVTVPDRSEEFMPRGVLHLGTLQHHPVGEVLSGFQRGLEAGKIDLLLDLFTAVPRENDLFGIEEIRSRYLRMFEQFDQRKLSMEVVRARRQGSTWVVEADYELELVRAIGAPERMRGRVRYTLLPVSHDYRIAAIDY